MHVGRKDATDVSVAREEERGEERWKVEYRLPRERTLRLWISPKQGGSIVRIQEQFKAADFEIVDTVDCENRNVPGTETWFPKQTVYNQVKGDGEVLMHEEVEVNVVSLNKPIDPSIFTLKSIGSLTPGTFVHRKAKKPDASFIEGVAVWNGKILVPTNEFDDKAKEPAP